jgi:hypothetical protein
MLLKSGQQHLSTAEGMRPRPKGHVRQLRHHSMCPCKRRPKARAPADTSQLHFVVFADPTKCRTKPASTKGATFSGCIMPASDGDTCAGECDWKRTVPAAGDAATATCKSGVWDVTSTCLGNTMRSDCGAYATTIAGTVCHRQQVIADPGPHRPLSPKPVAAFLQDKNLHKQQATAQQIEGRSQLYHISPI